MKTLLIFGMALLFCVGTMAQKPKKPAKKEKNLFQQVGMEFTPCDGYAGMWGMDTLQFLQLMKDYGLTGWNRTAGGSMVYYWRDRADAAFEYVSFTDNRCDYISISIKGGNIKTAMSMYDILYKRMSENFYVVPSETDTNSTWKKTCAGGRDVIAIVKRPNNLNAVLFQITKK